MTEQQRGFRSHPDPSEWDNFVDFGPGPQPVEAGRSIDEHDFDPGYLNWRQQQMKRHDRDYGDWRREQMRKYDDDYWRFRSERREDFHQRFQDWVAQRDLGKPTGGANES